MWRGEEAEALEKYESACRACEALSPPKRGPLDRGWKVILGLYGVIWELCRDIIQNFGGPNGKEHGKWQGNWDEIGHRGFPKFGVRVWGP